eukprot:6461877-Pyramimonas_sp.AAC.1
MMSRARWLFREAVENLEEITLGDSPVPGPRSASSTGAAKAQWTTASGGCPRIGYSQTGGVWRSTG